MIISSQQPICEFKAQKLSIINAEVALVPPLNQKLSVTMYNDNLLIDKKNGNYNVANESIQ
ncbi:hypothetical protein DERF_007839 [Dermatophagoides farinae]|uniref:Uncharacterized protein n=1 Tax=Dermatophagoides farinae TaxID=6954 RepID=A0A922HZS7_DERFA|nr:hypothetical protein DERF_007839 [Dermatophagoides farinae]